jgi:hypothetical protein
VIERLLASPEPSVRYKARVHLLGEDPASQAIRRLRAEIKRSERVITLLAGRTADGRLLRGRGVYAKWQGAHWVLAALADLGYPPADPELFALRDQLMQCWLADDFYQEFEASRAPPTASPSIAGDLTYAPPPNAPSRRARQSLQATS